MTDTARSRIYHEQSTLANEKLRKAIEHHVRPVSARSVGDDRRRACKLATRCWSATDSVFLIQGGEFAARGTSRPQASYGR